MVRYPVDRAKYWCCLPTTEDEAYGDGLPRRPWEGILVFHLYRQSSGENRNYMCIHRFDSNNNIDHDSNASCVVKNKDLFNTESEALDHYKKAIREIITKLEKELTLLEGQVIED